MCSIIGSFNVDKIKELAELNRYRGEHSHSLFVICPETYNLKYSYKGLGSLNVNEHDVPSGYVIAHQQAPTTKNNDDTIHPAEWHNDLLWHNGIIKSDCVEILKKTLKTTETWETKLLLQTLKSFKQHIWEEHYSPLSNIDGSFSCLWKSADIIFLFRNEISPMFIDNNFSISSTKFKNSRSIEANTMWGFDINDKQLIEGYKFATVNNPYYFENI